MPKAEVGQFLVSGSEKIPFGSFYILVQPPGLASEVKYFASGGQADMFVALGIIRIELRRGQNVYFIVNEKDDPQSYGLDTISEWLSDDDDVG